MPGSGSNSRCKLGPDLTALDPQMRKGLVHLRSRLRDLIPRFESAGPAQRERWAFLTRFNATEMARATATEFEWAIKERAGRLHAPK